MVLFRVRGVPVIVGWSWLLVLGLVFWSLGYAVFPASYPQLTRTAWLVMAGLTTLLFFASVLAHELSHTMVTLREGVRVREIRLWLFGGVSAADAPLPRPASEFRVVAAGPATTAVLGALFLGLAALGRLLGLSGAWTGVPDYLARLNGLLLVFNLVPALPLDGGRLLHALLWWRSRDTNAATVYAGAAGRAFAVVLIAVGAVAMLTGSSVGGLWLVVIGWFLLQSVRQEVLAARAAHAFSGLRVRQLMSPSPATLDPGMTVADLADVLSHGDGHPVYPVVSQGRLAGVLVVRDAGTIPVPERGERLVASVMRTGGAAPRVSADAPATSALTLLRQEPGRAVVTDRPDEGAVVGVLSPSDLERPLRLQPGPRWPRARGNRAAAAIGAAATLAVLLGAAAVYHPPVAVVQPGHTVDVGAALRLDGVVSTPLHGRYLAAPVLVGQPTALGLLVAAARGDGQLVPAGAALPVGASAGALRGWQQASSRETLLAAAVAAARATGRNAVLTGDGVRVVALTGDLAARGTIRVGDIVVGVAGARVDTATALTAAVADRAPGPVALTVLREGHRLTVRAERGRSFLVPGADALGIVGRTVRLRASLPFGISAGPAARRAGPSSGLPLALTITDLLQRADLANGRSVAAAGIVAADGRVSPAGAAAQRLATASAGGADVVLGSSAGSVRDAARALAGRAATGGAGPTP